MEKRLPLQQVPTPAYVIDLPALRKNGERLKYVSDNSGAHILLAQKAFSSYSVYPELAKYISGTTASGYFEAQLGYEEMGKPFGKETHVYAPAFTSEDMDKLLPICDHIIFNSIAQWKTHREKAVAFSKEHGGIPAFGLRLNPEYSEIETDLYNPCVTGSRLGIRKSDLDKELTDFYASSSDPSSRKVEGTILEGLSGLHFHTHCEQGFAPLFRTIKVIEEKFGELLMLPQITWLNLGGGHHISKDDYDRDGLISEVRRLSEKYNVTVYLEPGEAVAIDAGYLIGSVLDIVENGIKIAILDVSAACHMPDVIEMPYRPPLQDSFDADEKEYTYRLGGPTCLAG